MSLYQDEILNHAKSPRHYGKVAGAAHRAGQNPLCGDEVDLYLAHEGGVISLTFESRGCALCRASASVLAATVSGRAADAALAFARRFGELFVDEGVAAGLPPSDERAGIDALLDMRRLATRSKCVLLPWETFITLLQEAP